MNCKARKRAKEMEEKRTTQPGILLLPTARTGLWLWIRGDICMEDKKIVLDYISHIKVRSVDIKLTFPLLLSGTLSNLCSALALLGHSCVTFNKSAVKSGIGGFLLFA